MKILLDLNYKIWIYVILIINSLNLYSQEDTLVRNSFTEDPETVFFQLDVNRSFILSNSALKNDFNIGFGRGIDFNYFIYERLTVGANVNFFNTSATKIENIGNIQSSFVSLLGLSGGYYHWYNKYWQMHTQIGFGAVIYSNKAPEDRFNDEGTAFWLQHSVIYKINKTVGVYIKLKYRRDHLNKMDVPSSFRNELTKHQLFQPGFGLQFNLQNPGG